MSFLSRRREKRDSNAVTLIKHLENRLSNEPVNQIALDVKDKVVIVEIDTDQKGLDEFFPQAKLMEQSLKDAGAHLVIYKNKALDITAIDDLTLFKMGLQRIGK